MRDQRPRRRVPRRLRGPGRSASRSPPPRPRRTSPHRARAGTAAWSLGRVEVAHREGRSLVHRRPGTLADAPRGRAATPTGPFTGCSVCTASSREAARWSRPGRRRPPLPSGQRQDLVDGEAREHHRSLRAVCGLPDVVGQQLREAGACKGGVLLRRDLLEDEHVDVVGGRSAAPPSRRHRARTRGWRSSPRGRHARRLRRTAGSTSTRGSATPTAEATTAASTQPRCCAPRRSSRLMASVITNPSTAYDANAAAMVGHDRLVTTKRIAVRPNRPTRPASPRSRGRSGRVCAARRLGRGRVRRGRPRARRPVPR